ncbi:response regulator [Tianweitania sp.]|uniref:response regulator n=1 Tax=Tianweitania sp. TaxID=2021634 RepID=UPI0028988A7F|nr:response regulator [Tianweitania sp.]
MGNAADKPTALIVDDEALLRMHAAEVLEENGYTVLEAATADEALQILATTSDVKLLFTDIEMPGKLDGLELARRVHDRWPHILLVVTSGRLRPGDEELPEPGCFIAKPYKEAELVTKITHQV